MATKGSIESGGAVKVTTKGVAQNLEEIEKRVAELKAMIKSGQPLTMGKTNFLSGLLRTLDVSKGAW